MNNTAIYKPYIFKIDSLYLYSRIKDTVANPQIPSWIWTQAPNITNKYGKLEGRLLLSDNTYATPNVIKANPNPKNKDSGLKIGNLAKSPIVENATHVVSNTNIKILLIIPVLYE